MTLRTVIAGCGVIAPVHLSAAHQVKGMTYTGAFDADASRSAALASRYALGRVYGSWADVLADEAVDAVDLCLPHHLHHPLTLQALAAGKHVLCEKPLANTTAQAAEMIAAAARAGRTLMPVHNRIFAPTLARLGEIITAGALGDLYMIKTLGIEPPSTVGVRPWLNQHKLGGGGVTLAQTIHFAYLCRHFMGDVRRVGCLHGRRMLPAMDDEDTAIILLQFASGSIGEMTSTFAQEVGGHDHRVTVYGAAGMATANQNSLVVTSVELYGDDQPHEEARHAAHDYTGEFAAVLDDFARAALGDGPPIVSALDGLRAVEIIEASARAAHDDRFVSLPLDQGI